MKKFKKHYIDRYYKFINKTKCWEKISMIDGSLYYYGLNRNYPTKIKPEDLPESFMKYWDGNSQHYLETAGVVDILYQPVINNHVFRDDSLYISYTNKINYYNKNDDRDERFTNWLKVKNEMEYERIWVWDGEIIEFLLMAEKYSGYNIEPIKEQMWNKMLLLKKYETKLFEEQVKNKETFNSWFNINNFSYKYK